MTTKTDRHTYAVTWSTKYGKYIARVLGFPWIASTGDTPETALLEARRHVSEIEGSLASDEEREGDAKVTASAFNYMRAVLDGEPAAELLKLRFELFKTIQDHKNWDGDKWEVEEKTTEMMVKGTSEWPTVPAEKHEESDD